MKLPKANDVAEGRAERIVLAHLLVSPIPMGPFSHRQVNEYTLFLIPLHRSIECGKIELA